MPPAKNGSNAERKKQAMVRRADGTAVEPLFQKGVLETELQSLSIEQVALKYGVDPVLLRKTVGVLQLYKFAGTTDAELEVYERAFMRPATE